MSDPDPDRSAAESATGADAPAPEDAATVAQRAIAADLAEAEANAAQAEADARAAQTTTKTRRRPLGAVALLAVAAALMWASSRMTWVSLEVSREGMGVGRTVHLSGSTWFGALTPLALVLLATIAAVFATRGWLRRLVGVVVAVLAAVAAVPGFWLLQHRGNTAERAAQLAELRVFEHGGAVQTAIWPEWLSLLGALAAFVAGLLLVRMPAESARMSGKYDNPAVRKSAATAQVARHHAGQRETESASQQTATGQLSGRVLWDALDEGVDPTDEESNHDAAHPDPGKGGSGDNHR
ncbi:TIGR02234 family membrane protein [Nocardia yunnanensis]|uniref:TIGR02234 family membrane protein n=1 Tax=Nocardia yunnanensis TaxID=2382165 RepID=A0A386ZL97_9NOCA|nr:TIGR02234 family membrane protein [Nocardia yunnanensis]AYF78198.1 TIGR02234 family membrane protein [Nocardia yunnanensis]